MRFRIRALFPAVVIALFFCLIVHPSAASTFTPVLDTTITWIGSVTTEGDAVMGSDVARTTFGVDGSGIKIGVISDSFNGSGSTPSVTTQIGAGNLPGVGNPNGYTTAVTVVKDSTGTDEGRAMLEIVHDVAPGAQLFFHSAFNNPGAPGSAPSTTIANAINALVSAGVNVIVDDVGILTQARFQDGPAAQAVDAAKAAGVAYFSSAGNSGTDATRHNYTGGVGGTLDFGTDDVLGINYTNTSGARLVVQWDQPYPSISGPFATTNFAVDLTSADGLTTFLTFDLNGAGGDPFEFVAFSGGAPGLLGLRVRHVSGPTDVFVQISDFNGVNISDVDDTNTATVFGHAAALGAVAVAAHFHSDLTSVEAFSSRGPTEIFFDIDGNPISETRNTPQITGPDGVSTTTAGFGSFFGTSAAAPHIAAVAALVLERAADLGVSLSVDELYQILFDATIDMHAAGFDNLSGFGRLDVFAALESIQADTSSVPEPSSFALAFVAMSAIGLSLSRRRIRG